MLHYVLSSPYSCNVSAVTEILLESERHHEVDDTITPEEAAILRDKIRGFYAYLSQYPSLMERRLYIGSHIPEPRQYMVYLR